MLQVASQNDLPSNVGRIHAPSSPSVGSRWSPATFGGPPDDRIGSAPAAGRKPVLGGGVPREAMRTWCTSWSFRTARSGPRPGADSVARDQKFRRPTPVGRGGLGRVSYSQRAPCSMRRRERTMWEGDVVRGPRTFSFNLIDRLVIEDSKELKGWVIFHDLSILWNLQDGLPNCSTAAAFLQAWSLDLWAP